MSKIILYDLEVSRSTVEGYGNRWNYKVIKFIEPQQLMCYSWKELNDKKVHFVAWYDFDSYKEFVESLRDLLNSADVTIAHNGGGFDDKMSNRFFIQQGIMPPKPRKRIDTLREAKRWFRFESNKLDDLGDFLEVGNKESIGYADLEDDFFRSSRPKSTVKNLMKKYNNQDVLLLEKIYLKMRPFMETHPNLADIDQVDGACPKCLSRNLKKEGTHSRRHGRVQSYSCKDCGGWCNDNTILKPGGRKVNGRG